MQGDNLSPFLFIIVLDHAMGLVIDNRESEISFEIARKKSRRHPSVKVTDYNYAAISLFSKKY